MFYRAIELGQQIHLHFSICRFSSDISGRCQVVGGKEATCNCRYFLVLICSMYYFYIIHVYIGKVVACPLWNEWHLTRSTRFSPQIDWAEFIVVFREPVWRKELVADFTWTGVFSRPRLAGPLYRGYFCFPEIRFNLPVGILMLLVLKSVLPASTQAQICRRLYRNFMISSSYHR